MRWTCIFRGLFRRIRVLCEADYLERAGDTFVTLQWVSSNNQSLTVQSECGVSILYGRTDAEDMLSALDHALEREKAVSEQESAKGNTDGL